jgi:hypothetical protein
MTPPADSDYSHEQAAGQSQQDLMILAVARGQGRSIVAELTRRGPLMTTGPVACFRRLIAQFPHYNGYPDNNRPLQSQWPLTRLPAAERTTDGQLPR